MWLKGGGEGGGEWPQFLAVWWSCEFEVIYCRRWSVISKHKWIVKIAADNGKSREARVQPWLVMRVSPYDRALSYSTSYQTFCRTRLFGCGIKDAVKPYALVTVRSAADWFATSLTCCVLLSLFPAAPSTVSIMHQVSRTVDSITLSWSQPDQPNGVILDYELQYYEKVSVTRWHIVPSARVVSWKHQSHLSLLPIRLNTLFTNGKKKNK